MEAAKRIVIQEQRVVEEPEILNMGSDRLLKQPRLPQPVLEALQNRLIRLANCLHPLLIRLGLLAVRHLTPSLFELLGFFSLVSSLRQDRLAILAFFDDVRREEWTPSYAGKSSRIDFLLKDEEIVIEIKKTRSTLRDKEISDELIIDKERYQAHPHCKTLIAFVYDPDRYI